jgi:hypothetical protein
LHLSVTQRQHESKTRTALNYGRRSLTVLCTMSSLNFLTIGSSSS